MLRCLASENHVSLIGSEEDLSGLRLDLRSLLGEVLRMRATGDEAEPEGATADLDVEPIRLDPGREGHL
ncbi:hypothetical protein [Streptomyces lydicus]|uniref:hypothetical protein n=1 Tax=Streptomyces lydicus TaxID=47763 RepID=UPI0036E5D5FA